MEGLKGIGFKGYRSIGEKPVLLYPLNKVNLFVGPNNCGKSNILKFICIENGHSELKTSVDNPNYNNSISMKRFIPLPEEDISEFCTLKSCKYFSDIVEKSSFFSHDISNGIVWSSELTHDEIKKCAEEHSDYYGSVYNMITSRYGVVDFKDALKQDLSEFQDVCRRRKVQIKSLYIPSNRDLYDHNRNNFLENKKIIDKLNEIINNRPGELENIENTQQINAFVSSLMGEDVKLKIPSTKDSISITYTEDGNGERERSIEQLGSGIHEVIYFAIVATINKECIICIDEPEIHMHPRLQRQFLDYLIEHTDNQYFIATHSSAFLNTSSDKVSVFRTWMNKDNFTECEYCFSPGDISMALDELGCKASDILQTNCVIWVEGPSDRIYLNYWLSGHGFVEGVDYSVMFYGGRLISHLSSGDDDKELINLFRINRNFFIVIDSDKESEDSRLNDTKIRIQTDFSGRCWITEGREIENYLPEEQFKKVFSDCFKRDVSDTGKYANRLRRVDGSSFDKVMFAKRFVENNKDKVDFSSFDLEKRVDSLVDFIKKANS